MSPSPSGMDVARWARMKRPARTSVSRCWMILQRTHVSIVTAIRKPCAALSRRKPFPKSDKADTCRARRSMTAPVFVDTNVLLYRASDSGGPEKTAGRPEAWRDALWKNRLGRISFQVLQELYAQATRKWLRQVATRLRAEVNDLLAWQPCYGRCRDSGARLEIFRTVINSRFGMLLIVAAAKVLRDCRYLLTEDLQTNQNLDGVVVINPFPHRAQAIPLPFSNRVEVFDVHPERGCLSKFNSRHPP